MEYEIIASLGPASEDENTWEKFRKAGATGFRLNTSHLSLSQLSQWVERIQYYYQQVGNSLPLVLDLQGSKWRIGQLVPRTLTIGQKVDLVFAETSDHMAKLPVPHLDFFTAASCSKSEIILDDGKVQLKVEGYSAEHVTTRVEVGGEISACKGITYRDSNFRHEELSVKDREIVSQTRLLDFVQYAISYVRDATEMGKYRRIIMKPAPLIAKLERQTAINEIVEIAGYADSLWICRGDLGAELGLRSMAEQVYLLSYQIKTLSIPVLMAGQVLEHMSSNSNPTRSELCHLFDNLQKGYQGFVLSDECAIGRYPVESCRAAALFR